MNIQGDANRDRLNRNKEIVKAQAMARNLGTKGIGITCGYFTATLPSKKNPLPTRVFEKPIKPSTLLYGSGNFLPLREIRVVES